MIASTTPTVLFGLGATKAGSSWLYERLAVHPDCHFRTIKEHNYFPTAATGQWDQEIKAHQGHHKSMLERAARSVALPAAGILAGQDFGNDRLRRLIDRAEWISVLDRRNYDPDAYLQYLTQNAGPARVVGDITPAYALMSDDWLRRMLAVAPDVRMIFVVRDPLDRLWSHVRMIAARRDPSGKATPERAHRILKRTLAGQEGQITLRSDYATILPRLKRAIPDDRRHILLFDDLISGAAFPDICAFLGIAPMQADLTPVYASDKVALEPSARADALTWLAPQYKAAAAHFGALPESWNIPDRGA